MNWDDSFYELYTPVAAISARAVAPALMAQVNADVVVDYGCGEGAWLREFADLGAQVYGVEGAWVRDSERLLIPAARVFLPSQRDQIPTPDLAVCLETLNWVDEQQHAAIVKYLCRAPVVLFSAAAPDQHSEGFERERSYWADMFEAEGHGVSEQFAKSLHRNEEIAPWYRQNMFVAAAALPTGQVTLPNVRMSDWRDRVADVVDLARGERLPRVRRSEFLKEV